MHRRAQWIWIGVGLASLVAFEAFAATQSWVATARIRSGSVTLIDTPSPPAPMPTDTTGFLIASGSSLPAPSPAIDAGAETAYDIPNGTVAVTTGFDAISNFPGDSLIYDPYGGASNTYIDELTIVSGTLPAATPVTVRFVFDLAWDAMAISSLNTATALAHIQSVAAGTTLFSSASNRFFHDLDTGTMILNGLFDGTQHAEFLIPTTVGATISFSVLLYAASYGTVRVTGAPGFETNHTAHGWSAAAVSFGGEVVGADATLQSALLGASFPDAAAVSAMAAEDALPSNIFVPEPGLAPGYGAVCVVLGALRRRRRRASGH